MGSDTEKEFIGKFLEPLGVTMDAAGNVIKQIGESNVLWSSHTDTVHHKDGRQKITVTHENVMLATDNESNCLGADCTTGVYIMTEMIKANKPGLYVFHYGEERGASGSRFIAKNKKMLEGIDIAIAFDRYGFDSIITHQGGRCCSEEFSKSITEQMPHLKSDSGGVFTDTANYDHIVPECTNLSVGYNGHHSNFETQDLDYLKFFIPKIIALDTKQLVVHRDPKAKTSVTDFWDDDEMAAWEGYFSKRDDMTTLVKNNPAATADLLKLYGITSIELQEHIFATSQTV